MPYRATAESARATPDAPTAPTSTSPASISPRFNRRSKAQGISRVVEALSWRAILVTSEPGGILQNRPSRRRYHSDGTPLRWGSSTARNPGTSSRQSAESPFPIVVLGAIAAPLRKHGRLGRNWAVSHPRKPANHMLRLAGQRRVIPLRESVDLGGRNERNPDGYLR